MKISPKLGTAKLLYRCAQDMGLRPTWLEASGLFVVTIADKEHYINYARSPLNSHVGVSLSRDKHLARLVLQHNKIENIPFTRAQTQAEAAAFFAKHKVIIAKPIRGSGSKDIHIITRPTQLLALGINAYILEQYIPGTEMRYLVLNDKVIGVQRSSYGTSVAADRYLERISYPEEAWNSDLIATSLRIASIFGLKFTAIDYMIDEPGHAYILEINTHPGLKWFHAPTSGPIVDVARLFLEAIVDEQLITSTAPMSYNASATSLLAYI